MEVLITQHTLSSTLVSSVSLAADVVCDKFIPSVFAVGLCCELLLVVEAVVVEVGSRVMHLRLRNVACLGALRIGPL